MMCKLSEEIYRDGLHDRARADLKHLMESTGWSLVKAMQVLRIPPEEQDRCREELERFEPVKDSFRENLGNLSEENRILRELMDVVPIGCYILRPDHTVLYWNPAAEHILGFSAAEMQGKRCVDMPLGCSFTNSDRIEGAHCPAMIACATGRSKSLEMFMRHKNGKDILIRNTLAPLKGADGKVEKLISFFVPLTDVDYDQGLIRAIYETATRDPLTCLPGRKFMEVCLDESMRSIGGRGSRLPCSSPMSTIFTTSTIHTAIASATTSCASLALPCGSTAERPISSAAGAAMNSWACFI